MKLGHRRKPGEQGEGPCRGLLRDCTTSPIYRFAALGRCHIASSCRITRAGVSQGNDWKHKQCRNILRARFWIPEYKGAEEKKCRDISEIWRRTSNWCKNIDSIKLIFVKTLCLLGNRDIFYVHLLADDDVYVCTLVCNYHDSKPQVNNTQLKKGMLQLSSFFLNLQLVKMFKYFHNSRRRLPHHWNILMKRKMR